MAQTGPAETVRGGNAADSASGEEKYSVSILREDDQAIDLPDGVILRCWPVTLPSAAAVPVQTQGAQIVTYSALSLLALTPFFAFEVTAEEGTLKDSVRFVLAIPLQNAPRDRQERIIRNLLDDRGKILRYLLFLLAGEGEGFSLLVDTAAGRGPSVSKSSILPLNGTLFEALTRALEREPDNLDTVAYLVADLEKAGSLDLLPQGFNEIWPPIWQARQRLRTEADR